LVIAAGLDTWRIDLVDVLEEINIRGYAILRSYSSVEAITSLAASVGYAKGADSIGVTTLEGNGDANWLPAHTESLILGDPVLQCFALGCVESAVGGGATCLYDSRQAAQSLADNFPEMLGVKIRYRSHAYPGQEATHPLVCTDPDYGLVLRYRSRLDTNSVVGILPTMSEDELYRTVDRAVGEALTLVHVWRPGDFLIVNNRFMIHARKPYDGRRVMVRCRYDDPNHKTIQLAASF